MPLPKFLYVRILQGEIVLNNKKILRLYLCKIEVR